MLVWDRTETERVLRRWVQWAGDAPDEVTTSFRVLNLPPLPDIPEPFRGRQLVIIDGAVLASDERSIEILAALRELKPEIDTFGRVPVQALARLHMDPEGPTPAVSNTALLDGMPEAAIQAFVAARRPGLDVHPAGQRAPAAGRCAGPAASRRRCAADGATASSSRSAVGIAATPEMGAAGQRDADAFARRAGAVRVRSAVPELRRAPDRPERRLRPGDLGPAGDDQVGVRPGRRHRRKPPGAQDLRDRGLTSATRRPAGPAPHAAVPGLRRGTPRVSATRRFPRAAA